MLLTSISVPLLCCVPVSGLGALLAPAEGSTAPLLLTATRVVRLEEHSFFSGTTRIVFGIVFTLLSTVLYSLEYVFAEQILLAAKRDRSITATQVCTAHWKIVSCVGGYLFPFLFRVFHCSLLFSLSLSHTHTHTLVSDWWSLDDVLSLRRASCAATWASPAPPSSRPTCSCTRCRTGTTWLRKR